MSDFLTRINERLGYHRDNLTLWRNGTLTPTEPDEEERACTIRGLEAAIESLEIAKREYEANPLNTASPDLYAAAKHVSKWWTGEVAKHDKGEPSVFTVPMYGAPYCIFAVNAALAKARGEEAPDA